MELCYRGRGYTKDEILHFNKINSEEAEDLIKCLKSAIDTKDSCKLYNRVSNVLIHTDWYTDKQINDVYTAANDSKALTKKQKKFNLSHIQEPREDCMP
jgi:hypothetical protein